MHSEEIELDRCTTNAGSNPVLTTKQLKDMISKEIIEAVEVGILSDDQLETALAHYRELEKNLKCHGEIYTLVWRDVFRKLRELESYKKLREEDKKF